MTYKLGIRPVRVQRCVCVCVWCAKLEFSISRRKTGLAATPVRVYLNAMMMMMVIYV